MHESGVDDIMIILSTHLSPCECLFQQDKKPLIRLRMQDDSQ